MFDNIDFFLLPCILSRVFNTTFRVVNFVRDNIFQKQNKIKRS